MEPLKVFYSYAHEDRALCEDLKKHLVPLKRKGVILDWYDRDISAGTEWEKQVDHHLGTADLIVLMVSADFMASDYCWGVEVKRAMEQHDKEEARVVPVILRPCDWQDAPFSKLQCLPMEAKPVIDWPSRDAALLDVTKGIRRATEELRQIKEQQRAEERRKVEEQRRPEEKHRAEEQRRLEEQRRAEEQQRRAEERRQAEEQRRLEEQRRVEEQRQAEEQHRLEKQRQIEKQQRIEATSPEHPHQPRDYAKYRDHFVQIAVLVYASQKAMLNRKPSPDECVELLKQSLRADRVWNKALKRKHHARPTLYEVYTEEMARYLLNHDWDDIAY